MVSIFGCIAFVPYTCRFELMDYPLQKTHAFPFALNKHDYLLHYYIIFRFW